MKKVFYLVCICLSISVYSQELTNAKTAQEQFNKALSFHYTNKDSAYIYYNKAIKLADKHNELNILFSSYAYLMNVNGNHYDLVNYGINLKKEEAILYNDKRLDTFSNNNFYQKYFLFDKGNYNYKLKHYAIAKNSFKTLKDSIYKTPQSQQNSQDLAMLSSINSYLGLIYYHHGKYDLAKAIFNKDIELQLNYKDSIVDWARRLHNTKKLLARVFSTKKEYSKANKLLVSSLAFFKTKRKNPIFKNATLSAFIFLAENYIKQNEFHKALQLLNTKTTYFTKENPFLKEIDLLYGDTYLGLKKYEKALFYYKKSLLTTQHYRKGKHQDISKIYAKIGGLYIEQSMFDKGFKQYQLALIQLQDTFNSPDLFTNPNPEKVIAKTSLLRVLKNKLYALETANKFTAKISYLQAAHKISKIIIKTLDALRPEFESKLDKQFLVEETYPSIQKMVEISYLLYKETQNQKYIEDAFFFMEKSKSIFLLEAIRNSQATKYGNIPDSILATEQEFKAKITHIEKRLFDKKKGAVLRIKSELDSIKNSYYNFVEKLEEKYPKYYSLKYKNNVISLKEQSNILGKKQALFSFLVANEALFLVVIEANNNNFYKLNFDTNIQNSIINLRSSFAKLNIQDNSLYTNSYKVYKHVLAKALHNTLATDLTVIADGILNYLPLDALNTTANKTSFLLKTHSISYASSATLLNEQNKKKVAKNAHLLIFAPTFYGTSDTINHERASLTPLLYNTQEAKEISSFFKGKIFKEDQATISNFNKEVSLFNILHFATHASANDAFPDYSYLAFSKDSINTNLLYAKDIFNYQINADLVTLSACETGIGKLQKGEGMLSIARAFNYAGVPAMVNTLWKIDDQSTATIMKSFYQNLKHGLNKKEALRQAKLNYLELNEDVILKNPYYWSGIILTGNTSSLPTQSHLIWFIMIGVLSILLWIFIKKIT